MELKGVVSFLVKNVQIQKYVQNVCIQKEEEIPPCVNVSKVIHIVLLIIHVQQFVMKNAKHVMIITLLSAKFVVPDLIISFKELLESSVTGCALLDIVQLKVLMQMENTNVHVLMHVKYKKWILMYLCQCHIL